MKINSPKSIKAAEEVFRNYGGSWTAAREAAHRDADGVLVIPSRARRETNGAGDKEFAPARRKAG